MSASTNSVWKLRYTFNAAGVNEPVFLFFPFPFLFVSFKGDLSDVIAKIFRSARGWRAGECLHPPYPQSLCHPLIPPCGCGTWRSLCVLTMLSFQNEGWHSAQLLYHSTKRSHTFFRAAQYSSLCKSTTNLASPLWKGTQIYSYLLQPVMLELTPRTKGSEWQMQVHWWENAWMWNCWAKGQEHFYSW